MKAVVYLSGSTNFTLAYNSSRMPADPTAAPLTDRRVQWNALIATHTSIYRAMGRIDRAARGVSKAADEKYSSCQNFYLDHLRSRVVNANSNMRELLEIETNTTMEISDSN